MLWTNGTSRIARLAACVGLFAALCRPTSAHAAQESKRYAVALSAGMNGLLSIPDCRAGHSTGRTLGNLARSVELSRTRAQEHGSQFVAAVHAGDLLGPGPLSRFLFSHESGPQTLGQLISHSGFDHLVLGHSWYAQPATELAQVTAQWPASGPKVLNANVTCAGRPDCSWLAKQSPSAIVDVAGDRIALIGVTSETLTKVVDPTVLQGLSFQPIAASLTAQAAATREAGAAAVIAVVHWSGDRRGLALFEQLARQVVGVDLFVIEDIGVYEDYSAVFEHDTAGTPVVVVGRTPTSVSLLEFSLDRVDGKSRITGARVERVTAPDSVPEVETLLAQAHADYCQRWQTPLPVQALTTIDRGTFLTVLLDQVRLATHTEIALANQSTLARSAFPLSGAISTADVFAALRFDNTLLRATVKGSWLRALKTAENTRGDASNSALVWSGLEELNGQLLINGRPLDNDLDYSIVTTNYLASGGDGWITGGKFKPVVDEDSQALSLRPIALRAFARAKPGQSVLDLPKPHLESEMRWSWSGALTLSADDTRGANKAGYPQKSLVAPAKPVSNFNTDFSGRIDGDTQDHALRLTTRLTYGLNKSAGTDATGKLNGFAEAMYRWRRFWRLSGQSRLVPVPYFAFSGTMLYVQPATTGVDASFGSDVGLRFILLNPFELKVGAGVRRIAQAEEARAFAEGLVLGWDLPRFSLKLDRTSIDLESSVDYFLAPRAEGALQELRGRVRVLLPLTSILAFSVGYDVIARGERHLPLGYYSVGTVGITTRTTGSFQQF